MRRCLESFSRPGIEAVSFSFRGIGVSLRGMVVSRFWAERRCIVPMWLI
jgi:hypothetical protein